MPRAFQQHLVDDPNSRYWTEDGTAASRLHADAALTAHARRQRGAARAQNQDLHAPPSLLDEPPLHSRDGEQRYSPAEVVDVEVVPRAGMPDYERICTSHIERQNLTMRMQIRRLTRLTNAFSKKWENLRAAVALHFAYYNFCRVHSSLRVTPAMEAGITDHVWTIAELLA